MRRLVSPLVCWLLVGCGADAPPDGRPGEPARAAPAAAAARGPDELAAEAAAARAGCTACHAAAAAVATRLAPEPAPSLADAAHWFAADRGEAFLRRHHGGDDAPALAAWLAWLGRAAAPPAPVAASESAAARGERLWRELACGACHAPDLAGDLAARTDHGRLVAFLRDPAARRPGRPHDFGLAAGEAADLASWLLRSQRREPDAAAAVPGFHWACYELRIRDASLPDLSREQPTASGIADAIDLRGATRGDHFAMHFEAVLEVPADGEWTFACGSDDASWLWIDDEPVVQNAAVAPFRTVRGKVRLTKGPHALRVIFTEAEGGERLAVTWRGPGVDEQPIPASAVRARGPALVPPAPPPAPAADAVAAGRRAAAARRCTACHAVDDPELAALPPPAPAPAFAALRGGDCPAVPGAWAIGAPARQAQAAPRTPAEELEVAMRRDGCRACHARDGQGGLPAPVRAELAEVEDLGDEGRLPPDLTAVGRRLQPAWLQRQLAAGLRSRPYLRVRMPRLSAARAQQYPAWFAAADGGAAAGAGGDEPAFAADLVRLGQQLAGTTGRNCITCHTFAGRRALGPQGMDLAIQHERLQPGWFRDWLLHPQQLRPGTRMPALWPLGSEADRREVDALRVWLSLGAAAPLPTGLPAAGGLRLEPAAEPILHGAFLKGLSARCVAVGSPLRSHYAYDVAHARLAWLWRGDFLDAAGTWSGRAGQLLQPLGEDHVVLAPVPVAAGPGQEPLPLQVVGRRQDPAGYPIWRVRAGDAEYEDHIAPRLCAGGSEMVRTLRVVRGALQFRWPAEAPEVQVVRPADADRVLGEGAALEVVYRW